MQETIIEERVLLFFGLVERHTSQSHPIAGTPEDVPDPRTIIFMVALSVYVWVLQEFKISLEIEVLSDECFIRFSIESRKDCKS